MQPGMGRGEVGVWVEGMPSSLLRVGWLIGCRGHVMYQLLR